MKGHEKYKGALFDMDNTLYNFVDAKIAACDSVVELIGYGDGMELLRYFLQKGNGYENHNNIRDYMQDQEVWDEELYKQACISYEDVKLNSIRLYPGVEETLEKLGDSGMKMAVVTDAESSQAEKRLKKTKISPHFECVITPNISGNRKPNPETFLMALEKLKIQTKEAFVIGDSLKRDVEPCNNLGITTIFAKYGDWTGTPFPSIKPDYIVGNFSEILSIIGHYSDQR